MPARWLIPVAVALVLAVSLRRAHTRSVTESALTSAWPAPGLQIVATALRSPAPRPDIHPSLGTAMLSGSAAPRAGLTLRQELRLA